MRVLLFGAAAFLGVVGLILISLVIIPQVFPNVGSGESGFSVDRQLAYGQLLVAFMGFGLAAGSASSLSSNSLRVAGRSSGWTQGKAAGDVAMWRPLVVYTGRCGDRRGRRRPAPIRPEV
jgi:hypothetical protein